MNRLPILVAVAMLVPLAACGGGGSAPGPGPSPNPSGTLTITTTSLPPTVSGRAYSAKVEAINGKGTLSWRAATSDGLPLQVFGLSMDTNGNITGALNGSGQLGVLVEARDSSSPQQVATADFRILSEQALSFTATVPNGTKGTIFSSTPMLVLGGSPPYQWSTTGNVPPGLTLQASNNGSSAQISGTPTTAGTYQFTLQVADPGPLTQTVTQQFTVMIDSNFVISTRKMATGVQGRPYSDTVAAANGTPPYTWSAQTLATGLSISPSTGVVSGTPAQPSASACFTATDSSSPARSASGCVDLTIGGILQFTCGSLGQVQVNATNLHGFALSTSIPLPIFGGVLPITTNLVSGKFPSWMKLNGTQLAGPIRHAGSYDFTVAVQDSAVPPQTTQCDLTLTAVPQFPSIFTGSIPTGMVGQPYHADLAVYQGTPPLNWTIASGNLPAGLSLDPIGVVQGTPTASGTSQVTFRVTDSATQPRSASATLQLNVKTQLLPRNDSPAAATPLTNGAFIASLSPYGDSGPDSDYYKLTANGGAMVQVGLEAIPTVPGSTALMNSVLEIVDANSQQLTTCNDPAQRFLGQGFVLDPNPLDFNNPCINDFDNLTIGGNPSLATSSLTLQVPSGPPMTFYVHVLDWRGDARPDMTYQIQVSGAN